MDAIKQIISGEEAAIGLTWVSSKEKAENDKLSNSIESTNEITERRLEVVGRNDPSDLASEGLIKKKRRFEQTKTSTNCSWDLEPVLAQYTNKSMDKFVSNEINYLK